jgi:hypothetical protein
MEDVGHLRRSIVMRQAALAVDGRVIAAATEDSFARIAGVGYQTTGGARAARDGAACGPPGSTRTTSTTS